VNHGQPRRSLDVRFVGFVPGPYSTRHHRISRGCRARQPQTVPTIGNAPIVSDREGDRRIMKVPRIGEVGTQRHGSTTATAMPDHASRGEVLIHNCAWDIDPDRSRIEFRARSVWGLLPVAGRFRDIGGTLSVGETGALAGMLTINATSVDTSNRLRDAHHRGKQFLSVARQPQITVGGAECPTHGSQFAGSATVSARGQTFTVPIGGIFDCRGEEMTVQSQTVLRLSDFGILGARGIHPRSTAYQRRHHLEAPALTARRHRVLRPVPSGTPQPSAPAVKGRLHAHHRQP
jgi:polyisoprenoid-binding protein YceI